MGRNVHPLIDLLKQATYVCKCPAVEPSSSLLQFASIVLCKKWFKGVNREKASEPELARFHSPKIKCPEIYDTLIKG